MTFRPLAFTATATLAVLALIAGCSSDDPAPAPGTGGTSAGGVSTGGATGGSVTTGGAPTGGTATGGTATGGAATGGVPGGSGGSVAGGGSGGSVAGGGSGGSVAGGGSGGATGGTSGGGSGGSAIPATFATMKEIITSNLACQGCHGSDMGLDLNNNAGLYTRLMARTSVTCGNIPVINKGNPEQSAMIKMFRGTCPGSIPIMPQQCNPAMRDDFNCVPDDYIAAIATWIQNGAPEN